MEGKGIWFLLFFVHFFVLFVPSWLVPSPACKMGWNAVG